MKEYRIKKPRCWVIRCVTCRDAHYFNASGYGCDKGEETMFRSAKSARDCMRAHGCSGFKVFRRGKVSK